LYSERRTELDGFRFGEAFDLRDAAVPQDPGASEIVVDQPFQVEGEAVAQRRHRRLRQTAAPDPDRFGRVELSHRVDRQKVVHARRQPAVGKDPDAGGARLRIKAPLLEHGRRVAPEIAHRNARVDRGPRDGRVQVVRNGAQDRVGSRERLGQPAGVGDGDRPGGQRGAVRFGKERAQPLRRPFGEIEPRVGEDDFRRPPEDGQIERAGRSLPAGAHNNVAKSRRFSHNLSLVSRGENVKAVPRRVRFRLFPLQFRSLKKKKIIC
jgi:hypothetical protein